MCLTKLCVKNPVCVCDKVVCEKNVTKLRVTKLCEEEAEEGEEAEAARAQYRTKKKNPTKNEKMWRFTPTLVGKTCPSLL